MVGELYAMAQQQLCLGQFFAAMRGCFVVSRARVLQNPLAFYRYLLHLMEAPLDHPVHAPVHYPAYMDPSTQTAPALGHLLERSWAFIFRCNATTPDRHSSVTEDCVGPQCLD